MMSLRLKAVGAAAIFSALLLFACSGGGDDDTPEPSPSASPQTPVASPSATSTPGERTPTATPDRTPVTPTATVTPGTPGPSTPTAQPTATRTPIPPGEGWWPEQIDLSVGETVTFTLQNGQTRSLTLVSYERVLPRTKTLATVRVEGGGSSATHTLQVAHAGVPVAINGLWVYGYTWKEADDNDFEDVARQGSFPLEDGKDVGFAVNDALYPFYPELDNYTYPIRDAAFHEGAFLQTWLDPDGWAHSGFDIGTRNNDSLVAIFDGYAWYQSFGDEGAIWITENNDQWTQDQACWVFTHIDDDSVVIDNGDYVNKGDVLATGFGGTGNIHPHMGSCNSFDFGSWLFAAEVWNNEHADDFPAPRHWLALGPYGGDINSNFIAANESGDLPSDIQPAIGAADRGGGVRWKLADNFVNSVVRVGELMSESPFSGNDDRSPSNSVGYIATYIYSPADYTGSSDVRLKFGATRGARIWLNGDEIHDEVESRFSSYDTRTERAIEIDKYDHSLPLRQGWNTLIIKSDNGSRENTLWAVSPKIGDANGNRIPGLVFSTRSTGLTATGGDRGVSLSWQAVDSPGVHVESYMIDIATDPEFRNIVMTVDGGTGADHTVSGLAGGSSYYARIRPYNNSALGGTTYWQHVDTATFTTTGETGFLPSQSPPNGLAPSQVPMFVLLGSDDNNRAGGIEFFLDAFEGRSNPAGRGNPATFDALPAAMSFYLIGANIYGPNIDASEWRDQYMAIHENGHEIGNHGFFGLANEASRGSVSNWLNEWMEPTQEAIERMFREYGYSDAEAQAAVSGYRAAQDVIDPAMYQAIKRMGYEYGNSSSTNDRSNLPAWWAGTLDDGWPGGPVWEERDFGEISGVWEVPQTFATGSSRYCEKDWFLPPANLSGADWREDMQETFTELYNGNRAPMSVCLHSQEWGPRNTLSSGGVSELSSSLLERQRAMNDFLDWLLSGQFPDVRIVTHAQLLDWMRNPVPLRAAPVVNSPVEPTPTVQPTITPGLMLAISQDASRSNPAALTGQAVTGGIYVFTRPDSGVTRVDFYIDDPDRAGEPLRTENVGPFDLAGSNDDTGAALPFDTTQLPNGPHTITAVVTLDNGGQRVFTGTVNVQNG